MRYRFCLATALAAFSALTPIAPAHAVMEDYPSIKLQGLDKSVGRTVTFEAAVGSTIQYGPLFIKIHACRKAPPIEKPESAAFLQIWEVPPGEQKSAWVFSGWMFASSPALSAMDHPVYDVWVLDCTGREEPNDEAKAAASEQEADQTTLPLPGEAAPAEQNTDLFAQDPIPTDSEAEPDIPPETTNPQLPLPGDAVMPNPAGIDVVPPVTSTPSPDAPYYQQDGAVIPAPAPQVQTPAADDPGATAYDYMNAPAR